MRFKLCLLFLSAVIISFVLSFFSAVETAEKKDDIADKSTAERLKAFDKEELAKNIFFEISRVDDPAEKAMLYRKITDECSGTELAQEALWKLSMLYIDGFDEPNVREAIVCLEQFIKAYPDSGWRSHVEFSLLGLYESEKLWSKAVSLCEKLTAENPDMPDRLKDELRKRYEAAKNKAGQ